MLSCSNCDYSTCRGTDHAVELPGSILVTLITLLAGARIILLNCLAEHAAVVLEQARAEGMLEAGWVWVLTDGVTGTVSTSHRDPFEFTLLHWQIRGGACP